MKQVKLKIFLFFFIFFLFSYTVEASSLNFNKEVGYGNANDPYYNYQGYLSSFNINEIWYKYTCNGVVVAVLDDGVDIGHPDLKNNIWRNQKEKLNTGKDDDSNGYKDG